MPSTDPAPAVTDIAHAPGWSFLASRRWLGYAAMLLIFSIACVLLGNWQFDRRAQARAEIDRIDANYDATPIALASALPQPVGFDEDAQKWQTVEVSGAYAGDPYLVRNRPGDNSVGSNLIQPLVTAQGAVFFVDRGWVPVEVGATGTDAVADLDLPDPPAGAVTVTARLRASEPTIAGRTTAGRSIASIDLPELADLIATEPWAESVTAGVYTGAYGMLVAEDPTAESGVLPPRPERDEGPHLSYALQWYVFIIIAASGVAYAARREYRTFNSDSDEVREYERRSRERKRRRGRSDAEEEDALLDA